MSIILAVETAASACSVAVQAAGAIRAHDFQAMTHGQAEALAPMMQRVMGDAGLAYGDLDAVAVTVGPGSFTGIRIGLALARGVALAASVPCLGVTTMEALAFGGGEAFATGRGLAVLDTRRADVYAQTFRNGTADGPPDAVAYEALADVVGAGPVTVVGDVQDRVAEVLSGLDVTTVADVITPDARWVAGWAATRFVPGADVPLPTPLYMQPPQAVVPKNGGMLRP